MGRKRHIELTDLEQLTLHEALKNHPNHEFRRSCQALAWNDKGWTVKAISQALEVCPQRVSKTVWCVRKDKAVNPFCQSPMPSITRP